MKEETKNLIINYTDLSVLTKQALNASLESNEIFYRGDIFVEDNLDLKHASKLENIHEEIRTRLTFDGANFKRAYLATRLTKDLLDKPVFARALENKYFEQITTYADSRFNYEGPIVSLLSINNLSQIIETSLSKMELEHWTESVLATLTKTPAPSELSNIDFDIVEKMCIELFVNHFNIFSVFMDKINGIEDLSATIFSSITFKICLKLTPLIATKFLLHYNTDLKIEEFYKKIYTKCKFKRMFNCSFGKTKLFLLEYKRTLSVGFFGVTFYTILDRKYFNATTIRQDSEKTLIIPAVKLFVGNMHAIKANTSAIVYAISSTAGAIVDSFYKGFRDSLIKSGLELLKSAGQSLRGINDKK
jgi:hypothetical protein